MYIRLISLLFSLLCLPFSACGQTSASEHLDMAVEYFQSGKFHEALLLFKALDRDYELNLRYKAYIGVCCYYDQDYAEAVSRLQPLVDTLHMFAPQEQAVYYHCAAESYFRMEQYEAAIPLYEKFINVCHANEKAHAYYQLGFCQLYLRNYAAAYDMLSSAKAYYSTYKTDLSQQRLAQTERLLRGVAERMKALGQ